MKTTLVIAGLVGAATTVWLIDHLLWWRNGFKRTGSSYG